MAVIEFFLLADPPDVGVYTYGRSASGLSVMQLRRRVAEGASMLEWDTDAFLLNENRIQHHTKLLDAISKLRSCNCESKLCYRPCAGDDREEISFDQLVNLLQSEIDYDEQVRD